MNQSQDELVYELEQLIMAALAGQAAIRDGHWMTDQEVSEWANLLYSFNCGLMHMQMNMRTPHRAKELQ